MDNYDHEITCPEDKAVEHYLWYDYFHDSKIFEISFGKKSVVKIALNCVRDNFIYYLSFIGVEYIHIETMPMFCEYINGRFKDTALLRKIYSEKQIPLYNFRMKIDDGYIDIIFKKFIIRKKDGRINLGVALPVNSKHVCNFINAEKCDEKLEIDHIHSMFENDTFEDDFDKFLALTKLYRRNDKKLLQYARDTLNSNVLLEDSKLYAAYLLGKLGDESDIPVLLNQYFIIENEMLKQSFLRCTSLLPKRNILDAIELIKYRFNK